MKRKKNLVSSKKGCTFAPDFERNKGVLAQVARAFDWQSKGHRFDSDILHKEGRKKHGPLLLERGISSFGRAFGSQSKGNGFDSRILHNR